MDAEINRLLLEIKELDELRNAKQERLNMLRQMKNNGPLHLNANKKSCVSKIKGLLGRASSKGMEKIQANIEVAKHTLQEKYHNIQEKYNEYRTDLIDRRQAKIKAKYSLASPLNIPSNTKVRPGLSVVTIPTRLMGSVKRTFNDAKIGALTVANGLANSYIKYRDTKEAKENAKEERKEQIKRYKQIYKSTLRFVRKQKIKSSLSKVTTLGNNVMNNLKTKFTPAKNYVTEFYNNQKTNVLNKYNDLKEELENKYVDAKSLLAELAADQSELWRNQQITTDNLKAQLVYAMDDINTGRKR